MNYSTSMREQLATSHELHTPTRAPAGDIYPNFCPSESLGCFPVASRLGSPLNPLMSYSLVAYQVTLSPQNQTLSSSWGSFLNTRLSSRSGLCSILLGRHSLPGTLPSPSHGNFLNASVIWRRSFLLLWHLRQRIVKVHICPLAEKSLLVCPEAVSVPDGLSAG